MSENMSLQVIIIGGGPAGVSCAIWLKKLGVRALLLEAAPRLGGLQTWSPYENLWIPGVQGKTGQQVAQSLCDHATAIGAEVRTTCPALTVSGDYTVDIPAGSLCAPYLVIATGTRPRAGGFTPTARVAIGPGTPMESLAVKGKRIAILGGGDNGFDQARFVAERGGMPVIFSRSAPRAQKLLQEMIPDVKVVTGDYTADQNAMTINGEAFDAFGVLYGFEAVLPPGLAPELENGYVAVNRLGETSLPKVYACGEVTDFWHPCVTTAAAHGVQVAKQISKKLAD
ncbi:NAD(P)/FAD-dependent oxidoreductase [Asticcacaulis sp. AC402]|uniref:NAD(P)/FAD-dependent oxidoreductase n=1 Tax=Asticcacaulis sp. AC402 TaxID=1282361 RepID=UPI0003C3BAE9|nr:NAD(P)/FAD-dependent oxidoreductase [Asticcacaulis sp. AC402]ESQ75722.1 FAD-dependent pyridine nucleotide-disulfide oxidoreductase [Asticcacaulis sp. AC402]